MNSNGLAANNYGVESKRNRFIFKLSWKNVYSVFIALLPVIMIYNVPFINIGFSTLSLGLFLPYPILVIIKNKTKINPIILCIFVWFAYFLIRSKGDGISIFLLCVVFIHVLGALNSSIDINLIRKTIEGIAVICTALVLIQTIAHYLFGINVLWLIKDLVLQDNQYAIVSNVVGMYRPSAIFIEPSHYTQYCSIALLSTLFPINNNPKIKKAIWITIGCILTTSGMGIVLCAGIFIFYALFNRRNKGKKLISIIACIIAIIVAFICLMQFSFFSNSIQRIFGEVDGYNAIWGRTLYWNSYIGSMTSTEKIIGCGTLNMLTGYMTGLMNIIYCYGYLGVIITALLLVSIAFYCRNSFSTCCCIMFAGLMCIANLFSFISLTFWLSIIISNKQQYSDGISKMEKKI